MRFFARTVCLLWLSLCAMDVEAAVRDRIAFEPPLGARLPLSILLQDEQDRCRTLGEWLQGRPSVLAPVYFTCPNLCELTLSGVQRASRSLPASSELNVLAISIDPREQAAGLRAARAKLVLPPTWHLLHANAESIRALTKALGFRYFYDEQSQQFAHAAGIVVVDGAGRLTQYLPGVRYQTLALQRALDNAQRGRVGTITQRLLLTCFDYDPSTGRYSLRIVQVVRVAALASALLLIGGIGWALRRERRRSSTRALTS